MTLVLVAGCGLELRSLLAASRLDHVMDTAGLLTMRLQLPGQKYSSPEQRTVFYEQVRERFEAVPATASVAVASQLPVSGATHSELSIERSTSASVESARVAAVLAGPRYFETLGLRMLRGRALSDLDGRSGREGAVVNQAFAATHFPGEDPIGRRLQLTTRGVTTPWLTIVGVSPTLRQSNVGNPAPVVYLPYQLQPPASMAVMVRSVADAGVVAPILREEVRALDRDLPLFDIRTMEDALAQVLFPGVILGTVFTLFAFVAAVLAGVGLYAVTAYSVAQRTQELGIRMALGADRDKVVWLVLRRVIAQGAVALPIGLGGAYAVGKLLESVLVETKATDPAALSVTVAVMAGVCVAACFFPARRATRLDPVAALRHE